MSSSRLSAASDAGRQAGSLAAASVEWLFRAEYRRLTRTVMLLVDDSHRAEEVVQDAFAELVARWRTVDPAKARAYLYRAAMNRARSVLRRRRLARSIAADRPVTAPGADVSALAGLRDQALLARVLALPHRQRHAVVLRFYSDLTVAEVSTALGISRQAVTSATRHALSTLRTTMKDYQE